MSFPCQRIAPLSGDNRPQSMRRKLVFPLPFSPTTANRVPGLTVTLTSENSCRSPRLPLSATVWNIFRKIPLGLKKKNCRSVEALRIVLFANVFSTRPDTSLRSKRSNAPDRSSLPKPMPPCDNLWLREKRTRARSGIVAHLTSASQRWKDGLCDTYVRISIPCCSNPLIELSAPEIHSLHSPLGHPIEEEQNKILTNNQLLPHKQEESRWSRMQRREGVP